MTRMTPTIDVMCNADGCSQWTTVPSTTMRNARARLRDQGWSTYRDPESGKLRDRCPACTAAKGKKP